MKEIKTINPEGAPIPVGPYSQAVFAGDFIHTSGIIAQIPETGKLIEGDIIQQTNQIFDNLEAILKGCNASINHVVKVTVYLTDLKEFPAMNETYAKRFGEHKPARATVGVNNLAMGALVEMDFVAYKSK